MPSEITAPKQMTNGTRWRIIADYWAGVLTPVIAARYGCSVSYPRLIAYRRGFTRRQPDTLRKIAAIRKAGQR